MGAMKLLVTLGCVGWPLTVATAQDSVRKMVRRTVVQPTVQQLPAATRAAIQRPVAISAAPALVQQQDTVKLAATSARTIQVNRASLERIIGVAAAPLRVVHNGVATTVAPTVSAVPVEPGDFVFRKMGARVIRMAKPSTPDSASVGSVPIGNSKFVMPYRWLTIDSIGTQRLLVPYFVLLGGGLTYDVVKRVYRGDALIGVEDTLHPTEGTVTLVKPLKMQLATTSAGRVLPVAIAIAHTGLDYTPITIESPDSTSVRIRTGADPEGIIVPIARQVLQVAMLAQDNTLPGFGLATTAVMLTLPPGVPRADTAMIAVRGASVTPAIVPVSSSGASVRLRSGMPGARDTLVAYLDGVAVGSTVITYEFPWRFLSATMLGILLAGAARFFGAKRAKPIQRVLRDIAIGAPAGFIVACASAVGIDMLGLKASEPGSWAAVMVIAAVGAWLGNRILDRVGGVSAPTKAA
jgi:hypothetical protein